MINKDYYYSYEYIELILQLKKIPIILFSQFQFLEYLFNHRIR